MLELKAVRYRFIKDDFVPSSVIRRVFLESQPVASAPLCRRIACRRPRSVSEGAARMAGVVTGVGRETNGSPMMRNPFRILVTGAGGENFAGPSPNRYFRWRRALRWSWCMRRRDLLLLGTAAIAWPTVARPQTSGGIVPVIGFLGSGSAAAWQPALFGASDPIRQGLSETGFTEGKNIVIEYRWADDHYDRLPALAVELAQKDIAVLVAPGAVAAAKAAMAATRTIPIVFMIASDPVESGLVSSFNHPGGNVTGEGYLNAQLARNDSSCCTRWFPRRPRSRCSLIPPTRSRRNRRPKNCRRRRRRWVCNCAWPR